MRPRSDDELLGRCRARGGVLPETERAREEAVIPSADVKHWNVDRFSGERRARRNALPIGVALRMLDPVGIMRIATIFLDDFRPIGARFVQRQVARGCEKRGEGRFVAGDARLLGRHLDTPAEAVREAEGAALIGPIGIDVVTAHGGADRCQCGCARGEREKLRHALIGEAIHADLAGRTRQRRRPGDRLAAVAQIVVEKPIGSAGGAAAAHILNDHDEPMCRIPGGMRVDDGGRDLAAIGLAHQQHGKIARRLRAIDVGVEAHAVRGHHGLGDGSVDVERQAHCIIRG